ncbi:hypothetical protein ACFCX4_19755 [Kitasatospora sp. NPDC056327]|uniref:Rv1733c family protein n=1 Tax=Kitasatospora sp. NPDC056327 TaxID=3345785 RepID=UPI0035D7283D
MPAQQHPAAHPPFGGHVRRAFGRDRNPLCRPVDRARSRLVLAVPVVLAVLLAVCAATAVLVFRAESQAEREAARRRHTVTAVTAGPARTDLRAGSVRAHAEARWTGPEGTGSGRIEVPPGTAEGTSVPLRLDDRGVPVAAARDTAALLTEAGLAAFAAAVAFGTVAVGAFTLRHRALDRRAVVGWEPGWERVEPVWSRRR